MSDISNSLWEPVDAANVHPSPDGVAKEDAPNTVPEVIRAMKGGIKRDHLISNATTRSTGTGNTYVLTYPQAPEAYVSGKVYWFFADKTNTGAATLNVNGLGARAIQNAAGAALTSGQIQANAVVCAVFDGTSFRMQFTHSNPVLTGNVTATTFTATTFTGAHSGSGAALTALNASQLTTGTLPNARISGAYDGVTTLSQTGMHTITTTGEAFRIASTNDTSDPYLTFYKTIDSSLVRQGYLQSADGTAVGTTGLMLVNDVSGMRLVLDNTAGTNGLTHRVGSTNYNVWTTGNLPTPAVQATQIIAGNGLTGGGTLASNNTITLGPPGTITNTTTNTVTATGHTHALTLVAGDITGALGFTPANIASPAFTGTPTAPTQAAGNNSTRLATTAFATTAANNAKITRAASGQYAPTMGGLITWAHGLGAVPARVWGYMVCTATDLGYEVGDKLGPINSVMFVDRWTGFQVWCDATNVYARVQFSRNSLYFPVIANKTTGLPSWPADANWRVVLEAEL